MSKLHFAPRTGFYADIHFANSVSDEADASGLVGYKDGSKNAGNSTLAVSVHSGGLYTFKPLVHTISAAQGSGIAVSQEDGIVTLDASVNGGSGTGDTHFIGVIDSSANLDDNGACWVNTDAMFADYTYRHVEVHVFNGEGEKVVPTISFFNGGQAVKVDFRSKDEYVRMCSDRSTKMYVHIEVAPAYTATITKTAPAARGFDTDGEAEAYEKEQTKTEATRASSDITGKRE